MDNKLFETINLNEKEIVLKVEMPLMITMILEKEKDRKVVMTWVKDLTAEFFRKGMEIGSKSTLDYLKNNESKISNK